VVVVVHGGRGGYMVWGSLTTSDGKLSAKPLSIMNEVSRPLAYFTFIGLVSLRGVCVCVYVGMGIYAQAWWASYGRRRLRRA